MLTRSLRGFAAPLAAWAIILGCLPSGASAGPVASSNGQVKTTREEDVERIEKLLSDTRIVKGLARHGVTPDDLRVKMDEMSDHEVHMLAEKLDDTKSGGDAVVGLLILVLLIVLIVYLVQNM